MECVNCGTENVDRLVVESTSDTAKGGVCTDCDAAQFGVLGSEPVWHHPTGCALCGEQTRFALPRIDCLIEWDDNTTEAEYSITESTLKLCADHAVTLLNIEHVDESGQVRARA